MYSLIKSSWKLLVTRPAFVTQRDRTFPIEVITPVWRRKQKASPSCARSIISTYYKRNKSFCAWFREKYSTAVFVFFSFSQDLSLSLSLSFSFARARKLFRITIIWTFSLPSVYSSLPRWRRIIILWTFGSTNGFSFDEALTKSFARCKTSLPGKPRVLFR